MNGLKEPLGEESGGREGGMYGIEIIIPTEKEDRHRWSDDDTEIQIDLDRAKKPNLYSTGDLIFLDQVKSTEKVSGIGINHL